MQVKVVVLQHIGCCRIGCWIHAVETGCTLGTIRLDSASTCIRNREDCILGCPSCPNTASTSLMSCERKGSTVVLLWKQSNSDHSHCPLPLYQPSSPSAVALLSHCCCAWPVLCCLLYVVLVIALLSWRFLVVVAIPTVVLRS